LAALSCALEEQNKVMSKPIDVSDEDTAVLVVTRLENGILFTIQEFGEAHVKDLAHVTLSFRRAKEIAGIIADLVASTHD
jgi:hypothetical protein